MSGFGTFAFGQGSFGGPAGSGPEQDNEWTFVQSILNSLPFTFRRNGPKYTAWQNSVTVPLERMTSAVDAIILDAAFTTAVNKWLDAWGEQFGVARNGTSDALYKICITFGLTCRKATPVGMERYLTLARQIPCTIQENLPAVGWTLKLAPGFSLTIAQLAALPAELAFIRPAGVPYSVVSEGSAGGCLSTGNFLGLTRFVGSWLGVGGGGVVPLAAGQSTNQTVPLLPTTWMTDPTLNPSLSG